MNFFKGIFIALPISLLLWLILFLGLSYGAAAPCSTSGGGTGSCYVDNSCTYNGTGACNGTAPDCTCAVSAGQAGPFNSLVNADTPTYTGDDHIYLKKGLTFTDNFNAPSSGTAGHQVVYDAYGSGANPILTGVNSTNSKSYLTFNNLTFAHTGGVNFAIFASAGTIVNDCSTSGSNAAATDVRIQSTTDVVFNNFTFGATAQRAISHEASGAVSINNSNATMTMGTSGYGIYISGTGNFSWTGGTINITTGTTPNNIIYQGSGARGTFSLTNATITQSSAVAVFSTFLGVNATPPALTISGNTFNVSVPSFLVNISGKKHDVTISNNVVNDTSTGHGAANNTFSIIDQNSATVSGNTVNISEAIAGVSPSVVYVNVSDTPVAPTSVTISGNTINSYALAGYAFCIGQDTYSAARAYQLDSLVTVTGNTIRGGSYYDSNVASNAMHGILSGWTKGTTITKNYFTGLGYAVVAKGDGQGAASDWSGKGGGINYNLFHQNAQFAAIYIKGAQNVPICNNTIYNDLTKYQATYGAVWFLTNNTYGSSGTFKNNIVFEKAGQNSVWMQGDNTNVSSVTAANNLYYSTDGSVTFQKTGNTATATYTALADWVTQGYETTSVSLSSDPLFVSTSDFHLKPNSPAINKGVSVGLTSDYEGKALAGPPDIGAYEKRPVRAGNRLMPGVAGQ